MSFGPTCNLTLHWLLNGFSLFFSPKFPHPFPLCSVPPPLFTFGLIYHHLYHDYIAPRLSCFFFHTIRMLSHLWPPQLQSHKILITPSSPHHIRCSHPPSFPFFCILSLVTLSKRTSRHYVRQPIPWSCLWCHTSLVIVRSACFLNLQFMLSVYLSQSPRSFHTQFLTLLPLSSFW